MGSKKHSEISQYKNFETKIGYFFINKNNNNYSSNNNNNCSTNNSRHRSSPTKHWTNNNIPTKGVLGSSLRAPKCSCSANIQISSSDGEDRPPCKKHDSDKHQQQWMSGTKRKEKKQAKSSLNKIYLVLGLIAVCINLNGLFGDYVHDDVAVVLRNPDVQGKTPFWGLFLNDFWGTRMTNEASHKSFRPLTILSFR